MSDRDHARELGAVRTGLAVSSVLCLAELVGGWFTNSLALLTDAAHMLTDVAALALTLFALWIAEPARQRAARRSATARAEILAALVNGVVLCVLVLGIILGGVARGCSGPPRCARGRCSSFAVARPAGEPLRRARAARAPGRAA